MKTNLLLALSVVAGCVDSPSDDLTIIPKLGANALTPTELWGANLDPAILDQANADAMAATTSGKRTLQYAVTCALDATQSISGTGYSFTGSLGSATSWTTSALTTTQQQRVSACVIALTNVTGDSVTVSLRGISLPIDGTEGTDYQIEEGAFWGNMFLGASSWASACNGVDQAADDTYSTLPQRECAEDGSPSGTTPCSFTYAGLCSSACSSSNEYGGCNDGVHGSWNDVVTSYLAGVPQ